VVIKAQSDILETTWYPNEDFSALGYLE